MKFNLGKFDLNKLKELPRSMLIAYSAIIIGLIFILIALIMF